MTERFQRISLLLVIGMLISCAPRPAKPPTPLEVDTGEKLYQSALGLFERGSYDQARESFLAYYRSYPERPHAPAALLRIGQIHTLEGNPSAGRDVLSRLIEEYPRSPFAVDAEIGILGTYLHEGEFQTVLQRGSEIPTAALTSDQAYRLFLLLGDSAAAIGADPDACVYFAKALSAAGDSDKPPLRKRLKEGIRRLNPAQMTALLDRLEEAEARGYLLYELSLGAAERQRYDDAVGMLTELVEKLPDHEYAPEAARLIEDLKARALTGKKPVYRRYAVGCMLPLSGPYELYGRRALRGIELALHEFSADEKNPSITVLVRDTRSDPDRALDVVEELHDENVAAILGPMTVAVPGAFAAQDRGIPIITWTQRDDIPIVGDYVFRNFITPQMQVETLVPYAVGQRNFRRFAILYPDEPYGITFMNLFWDEVLAQGGTVVGVESYAPSQTDFADPIKKLVGLFYDVPEDLKPETDPLSDVAPEKPGRSGPGEGDAPRPVVDFDAVFIPDSPRKAGLVIPQLAYYDVEGATLLGTNLWHADPLIEMAGPYAQGAIVPDGFFAQSASEPVHRFTRGFQEVYREMPGFIEAITYDTAQIVFHALSRPEVGSRAMLKDALSGVKDYPGVTGRTSFDANGDCRKRLYLLELKKNRFVEINP